MKDVQLIVNISATNKADVIDSLREVLRELQTDTIKIGRLEEPLVTRIVNFKDGENRPITD